ncbi:MAG: sugar nucleotide-binding protein [Micromonosporaceae bacterium]|nr:sugar nucleotide-binding protein [Micromonosporaceae bacterium]
MRGRLLVTGASGFLGAETARLALEAGWTVIGTFRSAPSDVEDVEWRQLDVADRDAVRKLVAGARPDAVVHTATAAWRWCSASTRTVGRSYDDWRVTADGAAHVALAAADAGARLAHVSSDAMFSGRCAPYDETALPDPVNRYGAAKAAAETAVRAIAPGAAVVRTSLILGDGRSKHERHVLDLVAGRASGTLFTDELRCPVHVADLAAALLELSGGAYAGVLNVAGADALSRHELGMLIAAREGLDAALVPAGHSAELGAPRPTDTRLDIARARRVLSVRLRGAREFLAAG